MKKIVFTLAMSVILGLKGQMSVNTNAAGSPSQHPVSFQRTVHQTHQGRYLVFLPQGYESQGEKRWPLILFLHGMGERGDNLELVKKHGPPQWVESKPDFPFILVSPQCPDGQWWSNDYLIILLEEVLQKYRVDTTRVYLTGLSMGGFGTWNLALEYPQRFAAIAPICGGGNPFPPFGYEAQKAQALKTLPMWVFHGANDPTVKLVESERMVTAMRHYGCQEVEFTVYPEVGHDSWTETYNNPKLYEWFLKHHR